MAEAALTPRTALPIRLAEEDTDAEHAPDADPTEGTAAVAFPLAGPAMPFRVAPPLMPALRPMEPLRPRIAGPADAVERTLEVPCIPPPPATVLPFGPDRPRMVAGGG